MSSQVDGALVQSLTHLGQVVHPEKTGEGLIGWTNKVKDWHPYLMGIRIRDDFVYIRDMATSEWGFIAVNSHYLIHTTEDNKAYKIIALFASILYRSFQNVDPTFFFCNVETQHSVIICTLTHPISLCGERFCMANVGTPNVTVSVPWTQRLNLVIPRVSLSPRNLRS